MVVLTRLLITLASGNSSILQKQKQSLEDEIFQLKLEWIMAKTDEEKRRISKEIRTKLGLDLRKQ